MSKVSLAKYGFVRVPKEDFTYDGERYRQSRATFNNCEIRSSVCRYRGGDRVSANFYIEKVNGKDMSEVDDPTKHVWWTLMGMADLKRFDDAYEFLYTQKAVDEFMENLYEIAAALSQAVR